MFQKTETERTCIGQRFKALSLQLLYSTIQSTTIVLVRAYEVQGTFLVTSLPTNAGRHKRWGFESWVGKIPWKRKGQPTPGFLFEKLHRERSLVGYRPWGCEESERLSTHAHTHTHTHTHACTWRPGTVLSILIYWLTKILRCRDYCYSILNMKE